MLGDAVIEDYKSRQKTVEMGASRKAPEENNTGFGGGAGASSINFSFKVSISGNTVTVTSGKRCAIGRTEGHEDGWEDISGTTFTYASGKTIYMVWTNSTAGTPGEWDDSGVGGEFHYGFPPDQSSGDIQVVEIATITDAGGVVYGNVGNIKIYDVGECI